MKKRLISAVLGLCMTVTLLPVTALAEDAVVSPNAEQVTIVGQVLTDGMGWNNNGTVVKNGSTQNNVYYKDGVLYLNNAEIEGERQGVTVSDGSVTVQLSGENYIDLSDQTGQYAALEFDGDQAEGDADDTITIQGDGSLEVYSYYSGIAACTGKTLTIKDVSLYVESSWTSLLSYGVTTIENADVSMISDYEVSSQNNLVIKNSMVSVYGEYIGIGADSVTITDSIVSAQAWYGNGIYSRGPLEISNSIVEAYIRAAAKQSDKTAAISAYTEDGEPALYTNGMYAKAGVSMLDAKEVTDIDTTFGNYSYTVIAPSAEYLEWENPFTDVREDHWFYRYVAYVNEHGLMNGVSEDKFSPYSDVTRAQAVQMMHSLACNCWQQYGIPINSNDIMDFTDVSDTAWYKNAVDWGSASGVVAGMGNGKFAPNVQVTREQFALILYGMAQKNDYDVSASADLSAFSDVKRVSGWAVTAMQWAVGEGIIKGTNFGQLNPKGALSRAEAAVMIQQFIRATLDLA